MMNIQRRLKKIMSEEPAKREAALRDLAKELGCSLASTYGGDGSKHLEEELVRRIQEAARSVREARLWWIAFFSALASVISALASWSAIILSSGAN